MNTKNEYVAAEPMQITMYQDQVGNLHETREQALKANFEDDLGGVVPGLLEVLGDTVAVMNAIADNHPDMLRILLGDRDYT